MAEIRKEREFTISWSQATKIDWGTLLLFGGGITLGNLMFELKLAEVIGKGLLDLSGATSVWGITFGAIFIAIMVSETSSNTASANMVVPVMISLAQAAGVNEGPKELAHGLRYIKAGDFPRAIPPRAAILVKLLYFRKLYLLRQLFLPSLQAAGKRQGAVLPRTPPLSPCLLPRLCLVLSLGCR